MTNCTCDVPDCRGHKISYDPLNPGPHNTPTCGECKAALPAIPDCVGHCESCKQTFRSLPSADQDRTINYLRDRYALEPACLAEIRDVILGFGLYGTFDPLAERGVWLTGEAMEQALMDDGFALDRTVRKLD